MRVEMLRRRLDGFATSISRLVFQFEVGNVLTRPMMLEKFHRILAIFAMRKASVESNPRWPLLRAMRPVAEWRSYYSTNMKSHQTGEPWHLSCHGGKTPAKPHVPRVPPRPMGAVWGAGGHPLPKSVARTESWP